MTTYDINLVAQEIRASDAVVVMGAGVSFEAGMPLTGQLAPLVWHGLDSNPDLLKKLCAELGVQAESAKRLVGDDQTKINQALRLIKTDDTAFKSFKRSFCDLNNDRTGIPSKPHTELARLIHARNVIEAISFNWDTLLESAFRQKFGFEINGQNRNLWKPHGDCRNPDLEWVLPHEAGVIPAELLERLTSLASIRPRVLVIVGYAERDEAVIQKLITPLANRWRVFRINPSVVGEGAIKLGATDALERLADKLVTTPDVPGWSVVTFENQRGIEAAIAGERLGPSDVEACPRLPHFNAAMEKLSLLHTVEIAGESGSGKSITLWQLAHEFHRKNWQVLRLDAPNESRFALALEKLKAQRWNTVAVIDDSQIFPTGLIANIRSLASENVKVIIGTTDPKGERQEAVRAAAIVAVELLADHFRSQRATILPIVRKLDSRVGDGFLDIRFESRIDEAVKEKTPWQFGYVLRGSTHRVRLLLNAAHDFNQADLLLVLIAARQLATLDAGSSVQDLLHQLQKLGKSDAWLRSSLEILISQRAILAGDVVRCLHLQSASSIIEASLNIRSDQSYLVLVSALQGTLRDSSLPLRGISWLISHIWTPHYEKVITAEIKAELLLRCFAAQSHLEIRDACFVVARLLGRRDEFVIAKVLEKQELIRSWVRGADLTDAYAVGEVINDIHSDSHEKAAALIEGLDVKEIADKIGLATLANGYVWGYFTGRLCVASSKDWRNAVSSHFDREFIRRIFGELKPSECDQISEYLQGIAGFDFNFALELLELAAPTLATAIGQNSIRIYRAIHDLPHWVLGEGLFFDEKPTKRQRNISKRIFDGLDPTEIVRGIVTCRFGDWEYYARLLSWVKRAHPAKRTTIIQAMDWKALDACVRDHIKKPGREFTVLLTSLTADSKTCEPVASWLLTHANEIEEINSRIAGLSPRTALTVLKNGGTISLAADHQWFVDAFAVVRIGQLDENAAKQVLERNVSRIADGVSQLSLCEGTAEFLQLVAEVPEVLEKIFKAIDLNQAKKRWPMALADHRPEERKAARVALKYVSERSKDGLGELAGRFLREVRFRKHPATQTKA